MINKKINYFNYYSCCTPNFFLTPFRENPNVPMVPLKELRTSGICIPRQLSWRTLFKGLKKVSPHGDITFL